MQKVKIIPSLTLIVKLNPIKISFISGIINGFVKFGALVFPILFLIIGSCMLYESQLKICPFFFIGVLLLFISIYWFYSLLYGGNYKPGFSFMWWRLKRGYMLNIYKIIAVLLIVSLCALVIAKYVYKGLSIQQDMPTILRLITVTFFIISALYTITKSFKVHEDVDYVANQEASEILGMELDERIQASYEKTDTILIVTDKKIVFTFREKNRWNMLSKEINEISEIGILTSRMTMEDFFNSDIYLFLVFSDHQTKIKIKMSLYDKITSNPDLFIRKFLKSFDRVLLGKTDERIKTRRRVSINNGTKTEGNTSNKKTCRSVDLSETIQKRLHNSIQIKSSRALEF